MRETVPVPSHTEQGPSSVIPSFRRHGATRTPVELHLPHDFSFPTLAPNMSRTCSLMGRILNRSVQVRFSFPEVPSVLRM